MNYFRDAWNIFDFVTVLGSILDVLLAFILGIVFVAKQEFKNYTPLLANCFFGNYRKYLLNFEKDQTKRFLIENNA